MSYHLLFCDEMVLYEHRHVMDMCNIQVSGTWWSETDMQENGKRTRGTTRIRHVAKPGKGMLPCDTWPSEKVARGLARRHHVSKPWGDTWPNKKGTRGHIATSHVSQAWDITWTNKKVPCGQAGKGHVSQARDSTKVPLLTLTNDHFKASTWSENHESLHFLHASLSNKVPKSHFTF